MVKLFSALLPVGVALAGTTGLLLPLSAGTAVAQPLFQLSQTTADDYFNQGSLKLQRGDQEGAIADFNKALRLDPTKSEAIQAKIKEAFTQRLQEAEEANQGFRPDSQENPAADVYLGSEKAQTDVNRAMAQHQQGDYEGAIATLTSAIQAEPKLSLAYAARAYVRADKGDLQGSIADYTEAIRLDPKLKIQLLAFRAFSFLRAGNVQSALQDAEQSIQLDPNIYFGYIARGAVKTALGDLEAAQSDFNKAERLYSQEPALFYWRGQLFLKQGKYQQAIDNYEQSVRLSPNIAKSAYENYSLTARQQLSGSVATQPPNPSVTNQSPPTPPQTVPPKTAAVIPQSPTPNPAPAVNNVYSVAKATTVLINGQNPGSGVMISKTGTTYYLLTAKHVVATPDEYEIVTPSGKTYPVNYNQVTKLPQSDLAVVSFTSNESLTLASLGDSNAVSQGESIYISGWPAPDAAITQPSQITTKGELSGTSPNNADGYALLYDVSTGPGMSGGPIFNGNGQVIGIHGRAAGNEVSGKVGINLGIPIHLFLQQAPQAGLSTQKLGLTSAL
jgi:tetratricopeptide (TPR) repeat protein